MEKCYSLSWSQSPEDSQKVMLLWSEDTDFSNDMALKVQPPHPGLNHSNNNVTMVKVNVSMETVLYDP